ncbi:MAG: hypothetical protein ABI720_02965 [Actinomycetes bacterium]
MSTATSVATGRGVLTHSTWRAMAILGMREGRRIIVSPVFLLVLGFFLLMGGVEAVAEVKVPSASTLYDVITFFSALYLGLLVYISTHLVTSSARRTKAEPQLAASTLSARQRNVGLSLGVLFGPGLLALVLMVTAALIGNTLALTGFDGFDREPPAAGITLVQLGLTLIGAGLFAVMWANWLRFPGSLPLGLVVLVVGTVWLANGDRAPLNTWPWFAPYITAPEWFDEPWALTGSQHWHAAYLVGLCALAFCATMLREREGRARWLLVTGAVLAATAVAGGLQLP